jgi:hypothetical protein
MALQLRLKREVSPMELPIKLTWTSLVLLAAVGCGSEDASEPAAPVPSNRAPTVSARTSEASQGPMAGKAATVPAKDKSKTDDTAKAGEKGDGAPRVEGPQSSAPKSDDGASDLSKEQLASIKQLNAEDQPLALKQKICPVSDEPLGEMGKPVKVSAGGRTFFLCCKNCEKDVKADAKAVIAKLDKKAAEK